MPLPSARQEWTTAWPIPLISMVGYIAATAFYASSGVLMEAVTGDMGWSRAEFSTAIMVSSLVGFAIAPFVGRLIDRLGPRKMALIGTLPAMIGLSLFGLVDGQVWQWWLVALVNGLLASLIGVAVWVKAVVIRFDASRGMALAIVLAGAGFAMAIWPLVAAAYLDLFGWRLTYPAMALTWGCALLPLAYFLFADAPGDQTERREGRSGEAVPLVREVLLSRTFLTLALVVIIFSPLTTGISLHLVPLLQYEGFGVMVAAGLAGLAGIFVIVGRLAMGLLLDILPTKPLAVTVFVLPVLTGLLILNIGGSYLVAAMGIAVLGFVSGADGDIIAYLISRTFDQRVFASVYAIMISLVAVSASIGPVIAGACFDAWGSYDPFIYATFPLAFVSAILVASLPEAISPGETDKEDLVSSGDAGIAGGQG